MQVNKFYKSMIVVSNKYLIILLVVYYGWWKPHEISWLPFQTVKNGGPHIWTQVERNINDN